MSLNERQNNELREIKIETEYVLYPEGSVLFSMGNTKVLCNVSIEEGVPRWMKNQGKIGGWLTGEYSMLPQATHTRNKRETKGLKGRTQEISRLLGRSLRAGLDLTKLGERTITVDCDVLQADGGTRTASITGAFLALEIALKKLKEKNLIQEGVVKKRVAAVSVGILKGKCILDLNYEQDSSADVDCNIVMTESGELIEIQGTAEGETFGKDKLMELVALGEKGVNELLEICKSYI